MSVGILVAFDCLLRTGELLQLRGADIMMNNQPFATINLPDTIGEKRTGITDSVSVTDAALIHIIARFIQNKAARQFDMERVPQLFTDAFDSSLTSFLSTTCF